jgi:hypothetical protein
MPIRILKNMSRIFKRNPSKALSTVAGAIDDSLNKTLSDLDDLELQYKISTAGGEWLDEWGSWFNVYREVDEQDNEYRGRILSMVSTPKNTIPAIKQAVATYLSSYYGITIDPNQVEVYEPYTHIIKYSVLGNTYSTEYKYSDSQFYRTNVISIIIPYGATSGLKQVLQTIKPAGLRVVFNVQLVPEIPEGGVAAPVDMVGMKIIKEDTMINRDTLALGMDSFFHPFSNGLIYYSGVRNLRNWYENELGDVGTTPFFTTYLFVPVDIIARDLYIYLKKYKFDITPREDYILSMYYTALGLDGYVGAIKPKDWLEKQAWMDATQIRMLVDKYNILTFNPVVNNSKAVMEPFEEYILHSYRSALGSDGFTEVLSYVYNVLEFFLPKADQVHMIPDTLYDLFMYLTAPQLMGDADTDILMEYFMSASKGAIVPDIMYDLTMFGNADNKMVSVAEHVLLERYRKAQQLMGDAVTDALLESFMSASKGVILADTMYDLVVCSQASSKLASITEHMLVERYRKAIQVMPSEQDSVAELAFFSQALGVDGYRNSYVVSTIKELFYEPDEVVAYGDEPVEHILVSFYKYAKVGIDQYIPTARELDIWTGFIPAGEIRATYEAAILVFLNYNDDSFNIKLGSGATIAEIGDIPLTQQSWVTGATQIEIISNP